MHSYAPHNAADELFETQTDKNKYELCHADPCTKEYDDECNCCDEETSDDYDEENNTIIRGKWMFDGCKTIEEMIDALNGQITLLEQLKKDGWELCDTVHDDYAYLHRTQ